VVGGHGSERKGADVEGRAALLTGGLNVGFEAPHPCSKLIIVAALKAADDAVSSYGYGYPAYSYASYGYGYPAYGYGYGGGYYRPAYRSAYYGGYRPVYRPAVYGGYRVARGVAIHRARWR
jgi:hypothetical protein